MPPKTTPVEHGGKQVILTGSFDNWKQTVQMKRESADEFSAIINLDPHEKCVFKFVVDGVWRCSGDFPTESDKDGNVNNWRIAANEDKYKDVSVNLTSGKGNTNKEKLADKVTNSAAKEIKAASRR